MAIHTIQALVLMKAMVEHYDLFLEFITGVKDNFMTIQTSLVCSVIIGEIFRRRELVPDVRENIPAFKTDSKGLGVTLIAFRLLGGMAVRGFPEFDKLLMALAADTSACG